MYEHFENMTTSYVIPQTQGSTLDCGAFAAANAYYLSKQVSPCEFHLHQHLIRLHLKKCLEDGIITDFPHMKIDENPLSNLISNYFDDQNKKQIIKEQKLFNVFMEKKQKKTLQSTEKQRRWRQKQRQGNNDLFKEKNRRQRQDNREQYRVKDMLKFKEKRAEEQRYVRAEHRNEDLQKAKDKRAKEQMMIVKKSELRIYKNLKTTVQKNNR